jgi:hypothetical protein
MGNFSEKFFSRKTGYYNNVFLTKSDYFFRDSPHRKGAKLYGVIFVILFLVIVFLGISVIESYFSN